MAVPAGHFPGGLPGDGRRKTGWMRVGAAGDPGPWRRQAIPGRGRRDADALRGPVREQSPERWPTRTRRRVRARPVFRKGRDVVRRGAAVHGIGGQGHQLPGGRLRLPRLAPRPRLHRPGAVPAEGVGGRSGAPGRCACAGRHRVRHQAGHRAFDGRAGHRGGCSVSPGRRGPRLWCCIHGKEPRQAGKGCVPGVGADRRFAPWGKPLAVAGTAARTAGDLPEGAWRRLSAGDGTKGGRLYDWACIELADPGIAGTWTRGLPGRRTVAEGDPAFFPHGVPPARTSGNPAGAGGAAGRRGVFPDRQNRARPRPHRDTVVAWPAPSCFPGYARLCDDGHDPVPRQRDATAKKNTPDRLPILPPVRPPIPWSMQEIRRVSTRLARRRIRPAHVIAWSLWRRAHQAAARESHPNPDRNCSANPIPASDRAQTE